MVRVPFTAEMLGLEGGKGSLVGSYNKRFTATNGVNAERACLADLLAAAALGRARSDFGVWLLPRGRAPVYLRLAGAAKWSEWHKKNQAKACRPPSKPLPIADIAVYPPAAQQQFESMSYVPVLTATASRQPAEGVAHRTPLRVLDVVLPFDHTAEPPPGSGVVRVGGPGALEAGTQLAFQEAMRRPLRLWGLRGAVLLHHPSDPSTAGIFEPFIGQGKGHSAKPLTPEECPVLARGYRHDPRLPLVATGCMDGWVQPALVYFPSLFDIAGVWEALSQEEARRITKLRRSCELGKASILAFQLNPSFTIQQAIAKIADVRAAWFHGCIHLRWALQCAPACSQIHNFPEARCKKRNAEGEVIDPGAVRLVRSAEKCPAKAAFKGIVLPLCKMAQHVLLNAPASVTPQVLAILRDKLPLGLRFSYASLNIFWDADVDPENLPERRFDHLKKRWTRLRSGEGHSGLYVHRDQHNRGFGAVLIFGDFQGFDQRYVTLSLELPCPGWSLVIGDFEARLPLCRLREPAALPPVCALPRRRCCTP